MRSKWLASLCLAAVLCATSGLLAAEEEDGFKSGLQPGDRIAASFTCYNIAVPEGKPICYI